MTLYIAVEKEAKHGPAKDADTSSGCGDLRQRDNRKLFLPPPARPLVEKRYPSPMNFRDGWD